MLGFIFGIIYDVFYIIEKLVKNNVLTFFADILFMVFCAFSFFCVLIAFNNGEMRIIFLVLTLASFSVYLALFHKVAKFSTGCLIKVKKKAFKSKNVQKSAKKD